MLWDFATYPLYQFIYKPWIKRKENERVRSRCLSQYTTQDQMVFESPEKTRQIHMDFVKSKASTMAEAFSWAVKRYRDQPFLGTREILKEEDEVQSNGKMFRKYHLGDYRWITYEEADSTADYVGRGMRNMGLQNGDKIAIFADTRPEWYILAQACFKQGFSLVTLYTNLGEDAVVHGVNQTGAATVITSHELLPKFKNILKETPTVKNIIFFQHQVVHL